MVLLVKLHVILALIITSNLNRTLSDVAVGGPYGPEVALPAVRGRRGRRPRPPLPRLPRRRRRRRRRGRRVVLQIVRDDVAAMEVRMELVGRARSTPS